MAAEMIEQIAALKKMSVSQLRERYAEVFGEASKSKNKQWLFKRVAFRIQELAEGGSPSGRRGVPPSWRATRTYA